MRLTAIFYLGFSFVAATFAAWNGFGIMSILVAVTWPAVAFGFVVDAISACYGPGCLNGYAIFGFLGVVTATITGQAGIIFCGFLLTPLRWWWRAASVAACGLLNGLFVFYNASIVAEEMHLVVRPLHEHIMLSIVGFSFVSLYAAALAAAFAAPRASGNK